VVPLPVPSTAAQGRGRTLRAGASRSSGVAVVLLPHAASAGPPVTPQPPEPASTPSPRPHGLPLRSGLPRWWPCRLGLTRTGVLAGGLEAQRCAPTAPADGVGGRCCGKREKPRDSRVPARITRGVYEPGRADDLQTPGHVGRKPPRGDIAPSII